MKHISARIQDDPDFYPLFNVIYPKYPQEDYDEVLADEIEEKKKTRGIKIEVQEDSLMQEVDQEPLEEFAKPTAPFSGQATARQSVRTPSVQHLRASTSSVSDNFIQKCFDEDFDTDEVMSQEPIEPFLRDNEEVLEISEESESNTQLVTGETLATVTVAEMKKWASPIKGFEDVIQELKRD